MKNWHNEAAAFQASTDISRISVTGMKGQKRALNNSHKAKLEAELKLLEWHKLANDAALKVGHTITLLLLFSSFFVAVSLFSRVEGFFCPKSFENS